MTGIPTKPEKEFRVGPVRVAIWTNPKTTKDGKTFNAHRVVVERRYRDRDGNWKSTEALDANDVPKAILALRKAYEWITTPKPRRPEPSAPLPSAPQRTP